MASDFPILKDATPRTPDANTVTGREFNALTQGAAQRYAVAHNFEAVFHYQDATTQQDYYSPYMIARKVQSPSLMPIYQAPGLDISYEIVMTLNAAYMSNKPAAGQPAAGQPASRPAGN